MAIDQLIDPAAKLEFSLKLTQEINAATSVEEAFAATLRLFCQAGGWALGQVWLPDPDGSVLTCGPVWHATTQGLEPFRQTSLGLQFPPGSKPSAGRPPTRCVGLSGVASSGCSSSSCCRRRMSAS